MTIRRHLRRQRHAQVEQQAFNFPREPLRAPLLEIMEGADPDPLALAQAPQLPAGVDPKTWEPRKPVDTRTAKR